MDRKTMEELVNEQREKREPLANISRVDETHFLINNHTYELVSDPANSFDEHEFIDRFSTVFSKYDYIVGDWGFGQLRLKGFFADDKNVPAADQISGLQDYLFEYGNYGAGYFVIYNKDAKVPSRSKRRNNSSQRRGRQTNKPSAKTPSSKNSNTKNSNQSTNNRSRSKAKRKKPYVRERVSKVGPAIQERETKVQSSGKSSHRHFVIREKKAKNDGVK
ncbi:hypothetical protein LOSG293_170060 [Secundilactobacillus oryzae JCM 18671]|uniref:Transcriptional regulator n=1 Tax=Secundilactobacillus oryzae JCM 18671 TaxID=1291743 RepID=A0A081BIY6_9LACO|nr:YutD family protein [Secundilactobacillus oryzae]GAK48004.1 hypothetical protein LOSG293_170060 [Secundilactobacillus oryzae JCM 18671]